MFDESLIPILEEGLQKTRDVQRRLIAKLQQAEAEVALLRIEINALEESAVQTEKSINNFALASRSGKWPVDVRKSVAEGEVLTREVGVELEKPLIFKRSDKVAYLHQNRGVPSIAKQSEPVSKRFSDRTIIQSCTLLLRESERALHVNELYNLLVAGGMKFKGNNPTISVAVSLSRSHRFRKVDPGTFDLMEGREAYRAAS